jgi:predicted nucleic acid-binding protein
MTVVADTSPIRYLFLFEHVLPALFGEVIVPPAVIAELTNERASGSAELACW